MSSTISRMQFGGCEPVVSTYSDSLAESLGIDPNEAANLIADALANRVEDDQRRDAAWALLFLLRDQDAPPIDWFRAT